MSAKPTVYIETSVVSYLVARPSNDVIKLGHQIITVEWWETRLPESQPYISQFVLDEVGRGDADSARRRLEAIRAITLLPSNSTIEALARTYLKCGLIPSSEMLDALHLALASVHGLDYLVTWNCRHIAAATVRQRIVEINSVEGFPSPVICTPEELMEF